ncbi:MAG: hypothetical protein RR653_13790, partial [Clostridia bacterium]
SQRDGVTISQDEIAIPRGGAMSPQEGEMAMPKGEIAISQRAKGNDARKSLCMQTHASKLPPSNAASKCGVSSADQKPCE